MEGNLLIILTYAARIMAIVLFTLLFKVIKEYRLERWIKILVNTAEQIYQELDGAERLAWVKEQVSHKYKVDPEELDIIIEAFVNEINMQQEKQQINNNIHLKE